MFVLIEVLISLQIKQGPGVRIHMYDVATYIQYSEPYTHMNTIIMLNVNYYAIQNSQAVKKVCGPQKGYGEKRCEIQGGGQEMTVMVG